MHTGEYCVSAVLYRTLVTMTPITLRVKELREAKGWSQAELAEKAGIRRATLSAIEAEQTTGIDFETLQQLADVLGCDPGYLIMRKSKLSDVDRAVRGWMKTQGWPVTEETHHDVARQIYAWRHDVAGECYTLWIRRTVIEDIEPLAILEALNRWRVAEMFRERPEADVLVKKGSPKDVVVEQLPGPPK